MPLLIWDQLLPFQCTMTPSRPTAQASFCEVPQMAYTWLTGASGFSQHQWSSLHRVKNLALTWAGWLPFVVTSHCGSVPLQSPAHPSKNE